MYNGFSVWIFFYANINTGLFMEKFIYIYLVYQIRFCSGQTPGKSSIFHMN